MKRILIIDDNPENNRIFIRQLERKYDVNVAMFLTSARRMLNMQNYDLIVLDVMMPTQGLENTDEMNTGFRFFIDFVSAKNIKTLFWTRLSDECYNQIIKDNYDFTCFCQKSSDENHLLAAVEKII